MGWRERLRRKVEPRAQVDRDARAPTTEADRRRVLPEREVEVAERLVREGTMTSEQLEQALEYGSLEEWVKSTQPGWSPENPRPVRDEEMAWKRTVEEFQGHLSQLPECQARAREDNRPFRENVDASVVGHEGAKLTRHTLRCPYCGLTHELYYEKVDLYIDLG